jgi:NNP family nitrate/nitrite transporter-like MFS transporter
MDKSSKPFGTPGSEKNTGNSFLGQLGPLLILTSIFFFNFVSRITPAPLIPRMEKDLSLTHADAGTLFFMISLGYFITLIGSGFVSSRFNHKKTIAIANTALGFALIVKALAIHDIAPNLSFVAAPLICEAVMVWFSWRMVFLLIGFGALIMSPVFVCYGGGGEFKGEAPNFASFRQLFGNLSVWVMALLFGLGVSSTMGIYTMLPLYLVTEHGLDVNQANTLVALSRIPCIIIVFFGGWASDRIGPRRTLKIVLLITGLMTLLLGIASRSFISYIVFLQPLVAVCFFPAGFAALSLIVSAKLRNIAVSLIIPLAIVIGGGLTPVFIGFMSDLGSFGVAIMICGGLITAGSFLTGVFKFYDQ